MNNESYKLWNPWLNEIIWKRYFMIVCNFPLPFAWLKKTTQTIILNFGMASNQLLRIQTASNAVSVSYLYDLIFLNEVCFILCQQIKINNSYQVSAKTAVRSEFICRKCKEQVAICGECSYTVTIFCQMTVNFCQYSIL